MPSEVSHILYLQHVFQYILRTVEIKVPLNLSKEKLRKSISQYAVIEGIHWIEPTSNYPDERDTAYVTLKVKKEREALLNKGGIFTDCRQFLKVERVFHCHTFIKKSHPKLRHSSFYRKICERRRSFLYHGHNHHNFSKLRKTWSHKIKRVLEDEPQEKIIPRFSIERDTEIDDCYSKPMKKLKIGQREAKIKRPLNKLEALLSPKKHPLRPLPTEEKDILGYQNLTKERNIKPSKLNTQPEDSPKNKSHTLAPLLNNNHILAYPDPPITQNKPT